jgi:ferredoxin
MSYLLDVLRKTLNEYRHAGGVHACLLFYATTDANSLTRRVARLPEYVLPMEIDEIGAVGMEAWFAALAYGASHVVLWSEFQVAPSVLRESQTQLTYAGAMLEGMGYSSDRLQLLVDESADTLVGKLKDLREQSDVFPATFAVFDEKQTNLRLALDHLYAQAPKPRPFVSLPTGAPFGEVWVSQERCTLCMACASQCPTSALLAGDDVPQLKFIEGNCIQCGLWARSCPENAIGPSPRYLYDSSQRRVARVMYEEQPFNCVACGKPFATQKMIDKMTQKLSQHWMFQSKDAMRRVQMCDDCRVTDMYRKEAGMDVHAKIE